jgi:hypothetical protein
VLDFVHPFHVNFNPASVDGKQGCMTYLLQNLPCLGHVPSGSRGGKSQCRKTNESWSLEEVIKLVDSVEKHGVGAWKDMHTDCFSKRTVENGIEFRVRKPGQLKVYIVI